METKEKVKHTPIPWRLGVFDEKTGQAIFPEKGGFNICVISPVRDYNQRANGEFIVRACNAHDALVDAVKLAQSSCSCTIKERISGHRTECYFPIYKETLAKAEPKP